ncbi:ATP-dependent nuclease [Gracilibacillus alcaliphilus]|uniref:ATP-dependent nuclease n=1 Tax=Gracilibacillus alcaliphilus TaxID=1401441 RepID=UPI001957B202|nr:ATP-binding protein [Gracilibacillus alcaliphilus]MBM7679604.1 putative ATPase [Gracilibacillus alcaliphilus]
MHSKEHLISDINQMKERNVYDNYITKLVFPYFKNYTFFSEINFTFPLTIFVGKNGSGKSSALQALYGAPKGHNIGDYWFSTVIDPIEEFGEEDERHSYFYEYTKAGKKTEVLYVRMPRKGQPDYWETSRPRKKYNMNMSVTGRPKLIEKSRVYLDFRGELSAFDKFFYFGTVENLKAKSKQDYLRRKSLQLNNIISNGLERKIRKQEQNRPVYNMSSEEIEAISFILQEEYIEGKIIEHKLFGGWGTSVLLKKDSFTYSEAHAGSGEIAVTSLVHRILNTPPGSLILLDEPEVSLHPGAQKQLLTFLLQQIRTKKHQVIIATHSPVLTENLPKEAIKRFSKNLDTKKIDIFDECYPSEAFSFLGMKYEKTNIHVEDKLAKKIIDRVLMTMDISDVHVIYTPGGADYIKSNYIKYYSELNNTRNFVIFDGDQKRTDQEFDVKTLSRENENISFLAGKIKEITGSWVSFQKDGGQGSKRDDQIIEAQIRYLDYYSKRVFYLPCQTPEQLIWDDSFMRSRFINQVDYDEVCMLSEFKDRIYESCKKIFTADVKENHIDSLHDMLITHWLSKEENINKEMVQSILQSILNLTNFETVQ